MAVAIVTSHLMFWPAAAGTWPRASRARARYARPSAEALARWQERNDPGAAAMTELPHSHSSY
jgi:hypothetical protein